MSALPDVGACVCWRPTWQDHDYCVWHARGDRKTREDLSAAAPEGPERLDGAFLEHVRLDGAELFRDCTLVGAEMVGVNLRGAALAGVDFREATLSDVDVRRADLFRANLEDATVERCDLRGAVLADVRLDQAVFTNVRIDLGTAFGGRTIYDEELDDAEDEQAVRTLAHAAIWTYREIADLHETNALSHESRRYYFREKDVRRRLAWHVGRYARALKAEGARWVTGYGTSPWRVVGTGVVVVLVSAVLYPTTGGLEETIARGNVGGPPGATGNQTTITWSIDDPESAPQFYLIRVFFRSLYFSVVTFTTLGYGDISPIGETARAIAGVEALLGQILVALLVFVLSRRIS